MMNGASRGMEDGKDDEGMEEQGITREYVPPPD
jgi:hypothetical protein